MKFALALGAVIVLASPTGLGANTVEAGINFICGAETAIEAAVAANGRVRDGVGTSTFRADTTNAEAQAWFTYGINAYHGFLHAETQQALAKAAALDPSCALCVWAEALSLGSTLNYQVTPGQTAAALVVADRAVKVVKPGDERTAALVAALQLRYQPTAPPEGREQAFGKAMDAIARRYPDDDAIATMTAHALIIPARQDDYSGMARGQEILEAVLARKPDETAAIHYYIHATEFAGHAPLALPYAKRLGTLAPTAGHLVHMGTHTLMRVGLYQEVARANAAAMQVDAQSGSALSSIGNAPGTRYYLHNYLFGLSGAMMSGDRGLALRYADHARKGFPETTTDRRSITTARSLVALGRFAPDRALALTSAPTDTRLQKIYFHYARGEAFAARGDADAVVREADAIAALHAEVAKLPAGRLAGGAPQANPANVRGEASQATEANNLPIAEVAGGVLRGRAAMLRGDANQAAVIFAYTAIAQEKAFPVPKNFDPPPWWYPVRRSLAAAQLKAGRYAEAERAAHASLADWPQDALALRILAEAEARQGRKGAARDYRAEAQGAWRGGNVNAVPLDLI